jgi:hypothetical protein
LGAILSTWLQDPDAFVVTSLVSLAMVKKLKEMGCLLTPDVKQNSADGQL